MGTEWFETFFEGIPLELWEQAIPAEATRAEADFIAQTLGCPPGAAVLDVACGFARHSLDLAGRGYRMTGIDISHGAIARAGGYARAAGRELELICDDIRKLDRVREFDGAFWFGNGFGYLQHADTVGVISALARALKPGGRFILQTGAIAECLLPRFREREWSPTGDMLFLEDNHYQIQDSRVDTKYYFVRDGSVEIRTGQQHIYTAAELARLLDASGLHVEAMFGSLDRQPLKLGDGIVYAVTRRGS